MTHVPRRINVVRVKGIEHNEEGKPFVFKADKGVRYRAAEITGLKVLEDRVAYVTLTRTELGQVLGCLPVIELSADPQLWQAYLKVLAFLKGEQQ